jgi:DNA-directed RNA polymerase specialized sigma24 family protein
VGLADEEQKGGGDKPHPPYDYNQWHGLVRYIVRRTLPQESWLRYNEDVTQEVHIRLLRFEGELTKTLVGVIAERTIIDQIRKNGPYTRAGAININFNRFTYSWEVLHSEERDSPYYYSLVTLPTTEDSYFLKHVPKVGNTLRQRQVALLICMGYKPAEVAQILGITESRVSHVLRRLIPYVVEVEREGGKGTDANRSWLYERGDSTDPL